MTRRSRAHMYGGGNEYPTLAARNFVVQSAGLSSRSLVYPSPIVSNQLIVLFLTTDFGSVTTPSGYTQVGVEHVWWKLAIGTEGGATLNFTATASATSLHSCLVFSSASAVEAEDATGSGLDADPPPLTVSWGADKNLFMTVAHAHSLGFGLNNYPANCTLYHTATSSSGLVELVAGAESNLATFNPDAWDTDSGSYEVVTMGLHG